MTKLCINCKHFRDGNFGSWCQHPNVGISPVTGKIKPALAWVVRGDWSDKDSCGEDGKWFEPELLAPPTSEKVMTSSKPIFWQKLKGFFK